MKRCLTIAAILFVATIALSTQAQAQCPIGPNPLTVLSGAWSFKLDGLNFGAAGRFVATQGTDPRSGQPGLVLGFLNFVTTSNNNGLVVRQEADNSRYTINADCTGGTLSLVLGTHPVTFDFWFAEGGTKIYMVGIANLQTSSFVAGTGVGLVVTGVASRADLIRIITPA